MSGQNYLIQTRLMAYQRAMPSESHFMPSAILSWDGGGCGMISGEGVGIVTVAGKPASRRILCFERNRPNRVFRDTWSHSDGTYLIQHLNPDKHYIIMALDNPDGRYEPIAYDMIKPYVHTA